MARPRVLEIIVNARDNASSVLSRISDTAEKSGSRWRDSLQRVNQVAVAAASAVTASAVAIGKDLAELASRAEQSIGAVESVFGRFADQIEKLAKTSAQRVGLSATEFRELASVLGAQLKNMGIPMEDVAGQTDRLITLGADLAATFGGTTADAVSALSSLLRGEVDPIERYGVSIKEADIQARLAAMGLDKLEGEAAKQARTQAILALLTEQTADAQGQFARESDTAAGQAQRARAQWEDLRTELGMRLLPIVTRVGGFLADTLLPILQKHEGTVAAVAATVVGLSGAVLAINGAVKVWRATVTAATAAQLVWNAAMAANPIGLVTLAIGALIAAGVLLWQNWETVTAALSAAWGWLSQRASEVAGKVRDLFVAGIQAVRDRVVSIVEGVIGFIAGLPGRIRRAARGMWDGISDAFRNTINRVIDWWNNLSFTLTIPDNVATRALGLAGRGFTISTPDFPRLHEGGIFRAPRPGGEGLALLRDMERVVTPEQDAEQLTLLRGIAAALARGIVVDVTGADEEMKRLIRKLFRTGGLTLA